MSAVEIFYNRLLEIEGDDVLTADQLDIQMSRAFAARFIYEMTRNGDGKQLRRHKRNTDRFSHYHPDGFVDYRFTVTSASEEPLLWIKLKMPRE